MQSKATTVDAYLKEVPKDRLPALEKLRALCLQELKGYEEKMLYGGPCYVKDGKPIAGFASQKHFIGFYLLNMEVMDRYRDFFQWEGVSMGKGVVRFSRPDKIDYEAVQQMLAEEYASGE